MFTIWLIGAICAFIASVYLVLSCERDVSYTYPRWYDYALALCVGLITSCLSWVGVLFLLMLISIPRND